MLHTSWTGHNGAPQGITALAQTKNGQLWLGTVAGLYSFDGIRFRPFALPLSDGKPAISRKVQSLFVSREGGLWVIGLGRGAVYIKGATAEDAGWFAGKHARFDSLQQDSFGRIWAVINDHTLAWCGQDHVWHEAQVNVQHPTLISGLYFDSRGTFWAVIDDHLYSRAAGATAFKQSSIIAEGSIRFAETSDHTLWIVGQTPRRYKGEIHGIDLRHFDRDGHPIVFPLVHSDVTDIVVSHGDVLWLLENDIDRFGVRRPALTRLEQRRGVWQTDHLTSAQGLGNSDSHAMMEDVDGSLWIGGERQLERFRQATLVSLTPGLVGSSWIMCANPQSGLWVGSRSGILMHSVDGKHVQVHGQDGAYKLTCREDGSVWMLDAHGLSMVSGTSVHRLPLLAGHGRYLDNWGFSDVLETRNHRLIVAEHGAKKSQLWEFSHHRWIPFSPTLTGTPIHASYEDPAGAIYFGGLDDFIVAVEGKRPRQVPIVGGTVGNISAFERVHRYLFALGSDGAAVLSGDHFERLHFAVPEQAEMITGIVEDATGDSWINGQRGIVRISSAEMQAALNNPEHPILGSEVHEGDFVGPTLSGITSASAVSDRRGNLWFATLNGIVSLNASALQVPVAPPELRIESADSDGVIFTDHASLPPHVATVRIRYIGLSLTKPEDVRYSYKLEGVDRDWQTVGPRTEAVYTGLRPASYRFLVKASYGNGVWTQPVQFDLRIRPAFYQTWWFYSLCLLLTISVLATALMLRIRFLAKMVRERAEHRADERIRIARDLHDTLLQGVQGLMLTFHVAAKSIPEDSHTRRLLERALQSADRLLVEGRTRVTDLRGGSGFADRLELATALEQVGEELNAKDQKAFRMICHGRQVPIQPQVLAELFLVGREALSNAFRHSAATTIEITLEYEPTRFSLTCSDNGLGIPSIQDPLQTDRWGVKGMAERMDRVGGTFLIEGHPGVGTRVLATLPAARVYLTNYGAASVWSRLLRRKPADDSSD